MPRLYDWQDSPQEYSPRCTRSGEEGLPTSGKGEFRLDNFQLTSVEGYNAGALL
jgi:hypothetical protein